MADDQKWCERQALRRAATDNVRRAEATARMTLQEFCDAVRISRRDEKRVFVAVHLFAGARRDGDLETCLYECCTAAKIELLSLSIDLENDPQWDITLPDTFYRLYELAVEGLIDLGTAGPPCSTWSRLRFLPGGPRPLRFRSSPWGRPDLTRAERLRVNEANVCMLHALALLEAIIIRGGLGLLEHPEDPAVEPMPSVWATEEMELFLVRTGCRKHSLEQCAFDAPTKKPTGLVEHPGHPGPGPLLPRLPVALLPAHGGRARSLLLAQAFSLPEEDVRVARRLGDQGLCVVVGLRQGPDWLDHGWSSVSADHQLELARHR